MVCVFVIFFGVVVRAYRIEWVFGKCIVFRIVEEFEMGKEEVEGFSWKESLICSF